MKKMVAIANKSFVPICIVVYIMLIGLNYKYNCNPYLGYDEAGQFWISKGLNHYSDPLSTQGNVVDVIINNQGYNMDPGGFSVILHFWSKISNGYIWLRTLPYLFYLGVILSVIYLSYRWTKNKYIAVLMGFVPIVNNLISSSMFEVRAYSMEVLGVLVAIIIIDHLRERITVKRLLLSSILISVFMTSRYSYWIVAFVTSTYVLYLIMKSDKQRRTQLAMVTVYALPMMVTLFGVYFFALRWQNPELKALGYFHDYLVSNNPKRLLRTCNVSLFLKLVFFLWLCLTIKGTALFSKYIGLVYVTIVTNVFFLFFSVLGIHPWDADITRCISMMTLVTLSLIAFFSEVLEHVSERLDIKYMALLLVLFQFVYPVVVREFKGEKELANALTDLQSLAYDRDARFYVDMWESPCIRYQCECGVLKGLYEYPRNFVFVKHFKHGIVKKGEKKIPPKEWYQMQPYLNDLLDFDVLIVPKLYINKPDNSDKWKSVNNRGCVWYKKDKNEK